jgi:hypothetical protein
VGQLYGGLDVPHLQRLSGAVLGWWRWRIHAVLHHLPAAWNRYVQFTRGAEQQAQTLSVGQMIGLQATHALECVCKQTLD